MTPADTGPAEYEIFADKLLTSIPPNTPVDALRRAGAAGPLGDVDVVAAGVAPCDAAEDAARAMALPLEARDA